MGYGILADSGLARSPAAEWFLEALRSRRRVWILDEACRSIRKNPTVEVARRVVAIYCDGVPPVGNFGEWATPKRPPAGHFFTSADSSRLIPLVLVEPATAVILSLIR